MAICSYEYSKEGHRITVNCLGCVYGASIEDFEACMARTIDKIMEVKPVESIVLSQTRDFEYDYDQTQVLVQIARLITDLLRTKKILALSNMALPENRKAVPARFAFVQRLVIDRLRKDPVGVYVELTREIRRIKAFSNELSPQEAEDMQFYLSKTLVPLKEALESTKMIKLAQPFLTGYKIGDRQIYREIFHPLIRPNFMFTRYMMIPPAAAQEVDRYAVDDAEVQIYKVPGAVQYHYHVLPPEFTLTEEQYAVLDIARQYMAAHRPTREEFFDPERIREIFSNIGRDMLVEISESTGTTLDVRELKLLSKILTRYTVGYGVLEVILGDSAVQDVYLNAPVGRAPMYLFHGKFEECITNIVPTREDADAWATRFRIESGRPLDEANPVLDTEITIPGGRARIAAVTRTLSPEGLAFAFRRHRDKPWTYPLFISAGMMSPLSAGLLSFIIDGARSILIAGTRSAGKTSILGATMTEIMKRYRVITVEDSVTSDCQIVFERNGILGRKTIGELIGEQIEKYGSKTALDGRDILRENPENIRVFSLDSNKKFALSTVKSFIRHEVSKDIFEIETRTGRKIKVTGDHSLFTLSNNNDIVSVRAGDLKTGDYLVTPQFLPINSDRVKQINLLEHLNVLDNGFFAGEHVRDRIIENWQKVKEIAKECGYSRAMPRAWKRGNVLPLEIFSKLRSEGVTFDAQKLYFEHSAHSKPLPVIMELNDNLLIFVGLWLADGCYDKRSVIVSVVDEELRSVVRAVADKFNVATRMHSDGISLVLCSSTLKFYMEKIFGLTGNSYTKRFPAWIYQLSKEQIAMVLKGIYSGDGHPSEKEITINSVSESIIKDIQTFLLFFGIISRVRFVERDKTFSCRVSSLKGFRTFTEKIGFLQTDNMIKLRRICAKVSTHDTTDIIPFRMGFKEPMPDIFSQFNYQDYVTRGNNIGREKLKSMIFRLGSGIPEDDLSQNPMIARLNSSADSDIFWDEIKSVTKVVGSKDYVYDLSVPENENFVCENILAHNTLELPIEALRDLGYNVERLKSRSVITHIESELPTAEAIRTSLRLGDSCLILGEVRSSLRGSEEVMVVENGEAKRMSIASLEGRSIENMLVPTLGFDLKMTLSKLTGFVKHPERKKLVEITTRTGRKITVTQDHSLFTATRDFRVAAIECSNLKAGDQIVIPALIPCGFNDINSLNLLEMLPEFRVENFEQPVRNCIAKVGWKKASEICNVQTGDIYNYFRTNQKTNIPIESFKSLAGSADVEYDPKELFIRRGTSNRIPAIISVNEDLCRFLGYYVSEGYHMNETGKGGMVILTNSDKIMLEDFRNLSNNLFGIEPGLRQVKGAGVSTQVRISSAPLAQLISNLGCGRTCTEKRIPPIIYGLSKNKIAAFLRGLYSGDGSFAVSNRSGNCVRYYTTSKCLAEDLMYLLLSFEIIATLRERKVKVGNTVWSVEFKNRKMVETFLKEIGFVQKQPKPIIRAWTHTKSSTVFFDQDALRKHLKYPRKYRHLARFSRCSKEYLEKVAQDSECKASDQLKTFASGNFFLDEIKKIREIELEIPEHVYDLAVEPSQNFVAGFGGILAHNTEAKALYEAMRIGALSNVVAGTIHGDTPYGVFDRVVNDLGVPATSFKATDIIVIANRLKSSDGLHTFRRLTEITEVQKEWSKDPLKEKGFTQLMVYNAKTDMLEPTETLMNGESVIINEIAKRVREWRDNWEAVWSNIQLRAKIKEALIEYSVKAKNPNIIEAKFTTEANDIFHIVSEKVKEEYGSLDSQRIFAIWDERIKDKIKRL